ncbi:MAG: hypothetical protein V2B20_25110 [Pseudomonadota bacterium]
MSSSPVAQVRQQAKFEIFISYAREDNKPHQPDDVLRPNYFDFRQWYPHGAKVLREEAVRLCVPGGKGSLPDNQLCPLFGFPFRLRYARVCFFITREVNHDKKRLFKWIIDCCRSV